MTSTWRSSTPTRLKRTKPCKVCSLPASEAELVTAGLSFGWSPRSLAARFKGLTRSEITAHARRGVSSEKED